MRMLRFMKGVIKLDKIRNQEIRKSFWIEMPKKCKEGRLALYGHVLRIGEVYVGKET